jgi:hypothetical protein
VSAAQQRAVQPFVYKNTVRKIEVFTAVTMKNAVFWDIKIQFVLHGKHVSIRWPAGKLFVTYSETHKRQVIMGRMHKDLHVTAGGKHRNHCIEKD